MAKKYLRYLRMQPKPPVKSDKASGMDGVLQTLSSPCFPWMYEITALPMLSNGISMAVVWFTEEAATEMPEVIPDTPEDRPGEGHAWVSVNFDVTTYQRLEESAKDLYVLDRFHHGLLCCADAFRWPHEPFERARQQIIEDAFCCRFKWKKPLTSPDRRWKVQAEIAFSRNARIELVFRESKGPATYCVTLCESAAGSGLGDFELHKMEWLDSETVRITQQNGRDFWTCRIGGTPEFHYPLAANGNSQGEYHLAKLYFEGRYVPVDPIRGRELMEGAARRGFKQAVKFLERLNNGSTT